MIGFPLKICVVENLTDFSDLLPSAEGFAQALTSKRAPDSVRAGAHGRQKSARSMPANCQGGVEKERREE
jgi:hypothetical protein